MPPRKPANDPQPSAERPADAPAPAATTTGQAAPAPTEVSGPDLTAIAAILKRPFRPDQLGWKAQTKSKDGTKALAVPYVDARDVMNRLDEAVGIACWRDSYVVQADGSVLCRLELHLGDEWVGKEDVGGQSDQPDEGDRAKAAFSDALKRAAVKWGIARYLYYLPAYWVGFDGRNLTETPSLPHWALPPGAKTVAKASESPAPAEQTAPVATQEAAPPAFFHKGILEYDAKLAADGLCNPGDLVKAVAAMGRRDDFPTSMAGWNEAQVARAREVTKDFVERARLRVDVDRLMTAKGVKVGQVCDKVAAKFQLNPAPAFMTLSAEQLRYTVARLEEMPDVKKRAS